MPTTAETRRTLIRLLAPPKLKLRVVLRNFLDEPVAWLPVHPGSFCIFLPEDAHMPSIAPAPDIDKVVIKVAVDRR